MMTGRSAKSPSFSYIFPFGSLFLSKSIIRDLNLLAQVTEFYFSYVSLFSESVFKVTSRTVSTPSGRIGFGPRSAKTMSG